MHILSRSQGQIKQSCYQPSLSCQKTLQLQNWFFVADLYSTPSHCTEIRITLQNHHCKLLLTRNQEKISCRQVQTEIQFCFVYFYCVKGQVKANSNAERELCCAIRQRGWSLIPEIYLQNKIFDQESSLLCHVRCRCPTLSTAPAAAFRPSYLLHFFTQPPRSTTQNWMNNENIYDTKTNYNCWQLQTDVNELSWNISQQF